MRYAFAVLLTCILASAANADDPVVFARYRAEMATPGTTVIRVRWRVAGAATTGRVVATATYPTLNPYTTDFPAKDVNAIRDAGADPSSVPKFTEFTTLVPLDGPLALGSLSDLRLTAAADVVSTSQPAATVSRTMDIDLDSIRESLKQQDELAGLRKETTNLEATVQDLRGRGGVLSPPNLSGDVVSGKTTLLVNVTSDQAVKVRAEAFKLASSGKRDGGVAATAEETVYAYKQTPIRLTGLAPGPRYEIELTAFDIRGNQQISGSSKTLASQAGSPIQTLPDTTPTPTVRFENGKTVTVRADEIELPLVVSYADSVRAQIQRADALGSWREVKTEILPIPKGSVNTAMPVIVKSTLEPGSRYRLTVAALTAVDDPARAQEQDATELTPISPIAAGIEIKFVKDGIVFKAPTTERATIGVRFGNALNEKVTHESPAALNPEITLPLSQVGSPPLAFTVVISAADRSKREHRQVVTLAVDASDLAAKPKGDKAVITEFGQKLQTGQDAKLPVRTVLKTGLGAFLNVIFKGILTGMGG